MIISAANKDSLILTNIVDTLAQIRIGGVAMVPLVLEGTGDVDLTFYVDAEKTTTLFTDSSTDHPERFTVNGTKTIYTPPDEEINYTQDALSALYSQKTYYVSAVVGTSTINTTYANSKNMLFRSVIVASKKNPDFSTADNTAIIVPQPAKEVPNPYAFHSTVQTAYDVYLQLTLPNLTNLSEESKVHTANLITNVIRLALYIDKYRGGNCCFLDKDVDGTLVESCEIMESSGMIFRGKVRVRTAYMSSTTTF